MKIDSRFAVVSTREQFVIDQKRGEECAANLQFFLVGHVSVGHIQVCSSRIEWLQVGQDARDATAYRLLGSRRVSVVRNVGRFSGGGSTATYDCIDEKKRCLEDEEIRIDHGARHEKRDVTDGGHEKAEISFFILQAHNGSICKREKLDSGTLVYLRLDSRVGER